LLYDGYLYFLRSHSGVLSCLDASTGAVHYEGHRLEGLGTVYSSPIGAAGRVYITSREGVTAVVALGPKPEMLGTNQLDNGIDASLVPIGDELYVRGTKHLYCIAETGS
jgi:hypothetical protein